MRGKRAFSLVETMIALLIFAIGVLALSQIPAIYGKLMAVSVEKENAALYAVGAADLLESLPFADIGESAAPVLAASLDLPDGYSLLLSVDHSAAGSKTVTVIIEHAAGTGKKSVSVARVVSSLAGE